MEEDHERLATPLRRFIAFLIDTMIILPVGIVVASIIAMGWGLFFPSGENTDDLIESLGFISFLIATLIYFFYFTAFTARGGQTLGKKMIGIRVIRTDGTNPTFKTTFTREVLGRLAAAFYGYFLGYVWILFDKNHRGWHDKIAETLVVQTDAAHETTNQPK